jgi:hypothetical protein
MEIDGVDGSIVFPGGTGELVQVITYKFKLRSFEEESTTWQ